jgi:MFS family permease
LTTDPHGMRETRAQATGIRHLWPTFLVGATHMAIASAMTPLIPLYAASRGASPTVIGIIAASAGLLPFLLGVWAGAGADAIGARRMGVGGAVTLAASAVLIARAPSLGIIALGTGIAGVANSILIVANQTSVAHGSRAEDRDRHFGVFAFWVALGQMTGPLAGGLIAEARSITTALYVCAVLAAVPAMLALWQVPAPRRAGGADPVLIWSARHAYGAAWNLAKRADLRFIMWIAFIIVFAWSVKSSFYPLYLQSVGLPKSAIGLIFSCMGAGSVIVRPLTGTLSARLGRSRVLLGAVATAAAALGITPFLRTFWLLAAAATAAGMAWGLTQPLTMSLMAGSVAPRERGLALSLRMTSNRFGEVASPLLFGALVTQLGLGSAFFLSAAALAVGIWIIAGRTWITAGASALTPRPEENPSETPNSP